MTDAQSIIGHHGTSSDFEGYPTPQTDIYGLTGIFFTESRDDADYFAEMNTEGTSDGPRRVFTAMIDMTDVEDLSHMEEQDEIIDAANKSTASVIILPDMSGVSEREILVVRTRAISWE